jgi:hypothetical protein
MPSVTARCDERSTRGSWTSRAVCLTAAALLIAVSALCVSAPADSPASQEQYMIWKKSKHAVTLEGMPEKYKTDASCLKCHSSGFGSPTGYKDSSTPDLAGVACEACHGPGSHHDQVCQAFKNKKTLSPDEEKTARGSITRMPDKVFCMECHTEKGHKPHPKYDK